MTGPKRPPRSPSDTEELASQARACVLLRCNKPQFRELVRRGVVEPVGTQGRWPRYNAYQLSKLAEGLSLLVKWRDARESRSSLPPPLAPVRPGRSAPKPKAVAPAHPGHGEQEPEAPVQTYRPEAPLYRPEAPPYRPEAPRYYPQPAANQGQDAIRPRSDGPPNDPTRRLGGPLPAPRIPRTPGPPRDPDPGATHRSPGSDNATVPAARAPLHRVEDDRAARDPLDDGGPPSSRRTGT